MILAIIGRRNKDDNEEEIARRMTLIIASTSFAGSKVARKFDKMWPSRMRRNFDPVEKAKETLRKFRERTALIKANEKVNAGRTKNSGNQ